MLKTGLFNTYSKMMHDYDSRLKGFYRPLYENQYLPKNLARQILINWFQQQAYLDTY